MENRLRLLYQLQQIDASLDEVQEMKGDLPHIVAELEDRLAKKEAQKKELEEFVKKSMITRDQTDLEILALKEQIEKYKTQQFQVKTNRQYDALAREADHAQEKIIKLEQEMEVLEGKANLAKVDAEKLTPEIEELRTELEERKAELAEVNKEHEEEELRLKHEREKIVVRLEKADLRLYERIRKAKGGKAVVPVRRNACGGCFNRVPPQKVLELRKNARIITCEHCGRVLVSDEIVESVSHS
ncbi:MAG TPA: C4-type zinc ribbon domain-containing protein [Bacteroidota bacterium]|nr:C4-type zinc ribbon domain-containing protein [Bacteroidota bacterium]